MNSGTTRVGNDEVGYAHLVVIPSSPTPPVAIPRRLEILSRAEILARRNAPRVHPGSPPPVIEAVLHAVPEMHDDDMKMIPKNKGGRPKRIVA